MWKEVVQLAMAPILAAASALASAENAPDALIRGVTDEVLAAIRADTRVQAADTAAVGALVSSKVLPHFDARRATQIALGKAWREATPDQQERLVREFTKLLVRTYSGALSAYRDQTVEVLPLRARPADTDVTVRSRVRQMGAEPVVIEYDMHKMDAGWKVYDVRVAGISLVATYRTSFAEEIRNRGIDGLIGTLAAKNKS
jgi:phospholipid transport system substrate-binding protein